MKNRSVKTMTLIFVVLLLVVLYPTIRNSVEEKLNKKPESAPNVIFKDLTRDNISEILIKSSQKETKITRIENGWVFDGKKVNTRLLDNFFGDLKNLKVGEIISRNQSNHQDLGVSEDVGYVLTIKSTDGSEKKVIIGRSSTGLTSFYIREADKDEVYIADGAVRNDVTRSDIEWLDKTVVNVEFSRIRKIETPNFTLIKKDDGSFSKSVYGTETSLASEKTSSFSPLFSPLEGYQFLTDSEKTEFINSFKSKIKLLGDGDSLLGEFEYVKKDIDCWVHSALNDTYLKASTLNSLLDL